MSSFLQYDRADIAYKNVQQHWLRMWFFPNDLYCLDSRTLFDPHPQINVCSWTFLMAPCTLFLWKFWTFCSELFTYHRSVPLNSFGTYGPWYFLILLSAFAKCTMTAPYLHESSLHDSSMYLCKRMYVSMRVAARACSEPLNDRSKIWQQKLRRMRSLQQPSIRSCITTERFQCPRRRSKIRLYKAHFIGVELHLSLMWMREQFFVKDLLERID